MNDKIEAGGVKRVLNIKPVQDNWSLLPALSGLYHALIVDQANIVFPLVIDHERCRINQHLVKAVKPFNAQFQHGQTEEQGDPRTFQFVQLKSLKGDETFLLQKTIG
ncbi:hypothetical protein D3C78_1023210 [compost metagenome]